MSTLEQTAQEPPGRLGIVLTALGTLVAVAVVVLALTLPGSSRTSSATLSTASHGQTAVYAPPLIRYRGTGAPPARPVAHVAAVRSTTPAVIRHERSYGAVP